MSEDNMQSVIDAARAGQAPVTVAAGSHFQTIYTPAGGINTVDLSKYQPAPLRKTGTVTVFDPESFSAMLVENAIPGSTTVYVNPDAEDPAIVAVVNGNGHAGPGWADFRVQIGFRQPSQWKKWKAIDGKLLPQAVFAEFMEDNIADIASPDGATMMEIVTYLQATRSVNFRSGIKLSSGAVQLTNNENVEAQVGAGNIAVPDTFEVALSPMFGVAPFKIPARFRYRIVEGKLTLGFKLQRIEDVVEQVLTELVTQITLPEGVTRVYGVAP